MGASESVTPHLYTEATAVAEKKQRYISRHVCRGMIVGLEVAADFLTGAAGTFFSLRLGDHAHLHICDIAPPAIATGLLMGFLLQMKGSYRGGGSLLQIGETARAIRIPLQSLILLLLLSFLFHLDFPFTAFLIACVLTPALLLLQKQIFVLLLRIWHKTGYGIDRVVVYGGGEMGRRVVSALFHSLRLGLNPVAVIEDHPVQQKAFMCEMGYRRSRSVAVYRGPMTPSLLKSCECNVLIAAVPAITPELLAAISRDAKAAGLRLAFLSAMGLQEPMQAGSIEVDGLRLTPLNKSIDPWFSVAAKRTTDLIVSSLLLVLASPLLLLIAILIRLDSNGPALFIQTRTGKDGKLFDMYKFRSMYSDVKKYDFSPSTSSDSRITRLGRILRRTSLDELPQLINVFLGSMSLVGPRPEMPFIVEQYSSEHRQRLQVTPGITGFWQLSADRAFPIHENIQYDLYYIRNRSFFVDVAILIHTLFFAMSGGV